MSASSPTLSHLRWVAALLIGGLIHLPLPGQGPPEPVKNAPASCARIWQGFGQSWGYNHRIHRLADLVETSRDSACTFSLLHAAASGSGADSTIFKSRYVAVEAPGVGFYPITHTFLLDGREGEQIEQVEEITFYHPDLSDPSAAYSLVLNGFDLHAANGETPDKLMAFEVAIDSSWIETGSQTLHFRLRARLKMDCSSGECPCLDKGVHYELRVPMLAVVGGDFVVAQASLFQSQSWTRDSIPASDFQTELVSVNPKIQLRVAAITGISIDLSDEFHMLGWQSWIEAQAPTQDGLLPIRYGLGFQQWDPGMYGAYKARYHGFPRLPAKWVVKKRAGASTMSMEVVCLQFRAGEAEGRNVTGVTGWETRHGKKRDAMDAQGETRMRLW